MRYKENWREREDRATTTIQRYIKRWEIVRDETPTKLKWKHKSDCTKRQKGVTTTFSGSNFKWNCCNFLSDWEWERKNDREKRLEREREREKGEEERVQQQVLLLGASSKKLLQFSFSPSQKMHHTWRCSWKGKAEIACQAFSIHNIHNHFGFHNCQLFFFTPPDIKEA